MTSLLAMGGIVTPMNQPVSLMPTMVPEPGVLVSGSEPGLD